MRAAWYDRQGPAAEVFESPKTEYTKALMAAAFEIKAVTTGAVAT